MVNHTEVDGVPCFWVDAGRPHLHARLVFRFGYADESFAESGWQHLIEHALLHRLQSDFDIQLNGQVRQHETVFELDGDPGTVAHAIERLTWHISRPDWLFLDHEKEVLIAEAGIRGVSPAAEALGIRYGAGGPGLVAFEEPGLERATNHRLSMRTCRAFGRENAALVLDGMPPAGLALHLPGSARVALRPAIPVRSRPAMYRGECVDVTVLSGEVARTPSGAATAAMLEHLLTLKLRREMGAAYAPWSLYEPADAVSAVVIAGSDLRPEYRDDGPRLALEALQELTSEPERVNGALQSEIQRALRGLADHFAGPRLAYDLARLYLQDMPVRSIEEYAEAIRAIAPETVAGDAGRMQSTLLVSASTRASASSLSLPPIEFPVELSRPATGGYRHVNWPAVEHVLVLQQDRIEISTGNGLSRAVGINDLVAVLAFPDGVRRIVRRDGFGLTIDPAQWKHGVHAVGHLDSLVPQEAILPQRQGPVSPVVARPTRRAQARARLRVLRLHRLRPNLATYALVLLGCLVPVGFVVLLAVTLFLLDSPMAVVLLALVGVTVLWWWRQDR